MPICNNVSAFGAPMPTRAALRRPRGIRFFAPVDDDLGNGGTPSKDDPGFPANTPVADMTPEQQAAYWKDQSKKQQKIAEGRADYDTHKAASVELAALKASNATAEEKALADAKEKGVAEGKNHFLDPAVSFALQALTKRSADEIAAAIQFVDTTKFLDADGNLSADNLTAFAATLAPGNGNGSQLSTDPVLDALNRQGHDQHQQQGGSVNALADAEYERLTKKKNPNS